MRSIETARERLQKAASAALHRDLLCLSGRGVEVSPYRLRGLARDDGGQRLGRGLLHVAQAAEVGEQALPRECAYAGNIQQL